MKEEVTVLGGQEVVGVGRIEGPILIVEGATNVSYDEVVEIRDSKGQLRRGRVLEVGEGTAVVQVFAGSTGLSIDGTSVRFLGDTLHMPVAEEMLGRIFDGLGTPIDGGPQLPRPVRPRHHAGSRVHRSANVVARGSRVRADGPASHVVQSPASRSRAR